MEAEAQKHVPAMQERDGFLRAGRRLQGRYDRLKTKAGDLARGKQDLEDLIVELGGNLTNDKRVLQQQVEKLEDDNRGLLAHNTNLLCQTVVSGLEVQQTRDRVGNLERQVADFQTAEAADITTAVSSMGVAE